MPAVIHLSDIWEHTLTETLYYDQKLGRFKKGIKREETTYPTLNDERYSDGFSRSLYITAKSHECEQVLDPEYTPGKKDLVEAKQIFSVFDKCAYH